ncbi:MAG TPA: ADOP family duplicated permease [Gemmatimonadaceae bacterium]|nr:ADOP family duplicated permease [Gemmatimonadaceae bacterium]
MHKLRYAIRALRTRPGFAAAVILTLALGIGATTTMFAVLRAVVLHPLPYPHAPELLSFSEADNGSDLGVLDGRTYRALTASATSVSFAAWSPFRSVLAPSTTQEPEEVRGISATARYFALLGVRPLMGRALDARDSLPGAAVAVVSEQLWRRVFGADRDAIGRMITLDGTRTMVIGVMPEAFTSDAGPQLWTPLHLEPEAPGVTRFWNVIGRMRAGATMSRVRADVAMLAGRMPALRPGGAPKMTPVVMTLADRRFGNQRTPTLLLFGAVMLLLAIACANLANLAIARATGRQREFAVRIALGGRRALTGLLLRESVILALAGAALGLLVSAALVKYFVHLSPAFVGNAGRVRLDLSVSLFAVGVTVASLLSIALLPALIAGRGDLHRVLSTGMSRASTGARTHRLSQGLVVWQLAITLVLLTGCALVARSLWRLASVDLGFHPNDLLVVSLHLPSWSYSDAGVGSYYQQLLARVRALPGVESAAVGAAPFAGAEESFTIPDSTGSASAPINAIAVGPGYFRTVGAHILHGREFDSAESAAGVPVVVVSMSVARRFYPAGNAVGHTIAAPSGPATIVGVVSDMRPQITGAVSPFVYQDVMQQPLGRFEQLMVRTTAPAAAIERAIARVAHDVDPRLPAPSVQRADRVVAETTAPSVFVFRLLGFFGGFATLLAVIGLYGVMSRVVAERMREIGIRMALGAEPARLVRAVVGEGLSITAIGAALGLLAAVVAVRILRSLVYHTSVYDVWTWAAVTLLLLLVSGAVCLLAARKTTRVDPMLVLREE